MDTERYADLFWQAHARVSRDARKRYEVWNPDWHAQGRSRGGFFEKRWEWALADPEFFPTIMTLILEGK